MIAEASRKQRIGFGDVVAKHDAREQHNAGTASRYTRSRLLVTLEYQEEQPSQSMALKREWAIKSLSRKEKEALIESVK